MHVELAPVSSNGLPVQFDQERIFPKTGFASHAWRLVTSSGSTSSGVCPPAEKIKSQDASFRRAWADLGPRCTGITRCTATLGAGTHF